MLRAAIEKIEAMARPEVKEIGGNFFAITRDGDAKHIRAQLDTVECKALTSLDALVKMVKTEALERWSAPLYITIPDHYTAECFGQPGDAKLRFTRLDYYRTKAQDVPGWGEKVQLGFEEAIISLQTRFQRTPDTEYALKLLSEITSGSKVTYNDNGIAQTVVTQKGIAMQGMDKIRPIVELRPYRTFQEVEQPVSQFLIRINERGITFIEADGGMWKLAARQTIKEYLEQRLKDEVEDGKVVVAL